MAIAWIGFLLFVVIMLLLDLGVFHKDDHVFRVREALLWSGFWIALALIFNVGIYYFEGKEPALEFFTAYLLEKSLSVDNLFVFIMIFSYFSVAAKYQHRILFWGILGALVMRAIFIFAGVALITKFGWVMYIFGAFLVYSGIHMLCQKEEEENFNPNKNIIIRLFRKIMPVSNENHDHKFFVRLGGKVHATTFFVALLFIEASDVIFAIDSIPAVLSISKDTFIIFTSNIFAILGLRSLYFALNGVMKYFYYLKYALAIILSFIGIKMCINELHAEFDYLFKISNWVSLAVIIGTLAVSIFFSMIAKKRREAELSK